MSLSHPVGAVDPAGENILDELVDCCNAGDWDSVAALIAEEATSDFLDGRGPAELTAALAALAHRNPGLVLTRGELGDEPVVVTWLPDGREYRLFGCLTFAFTEVEGETLIEYVDYDDQPGDLEALLAEEPDPEDMDEGTGWEEWETGEA